MRLATARKHMAMNSLVARNDFKARPPPTHKAAFVSSFILNDGDNVAAIRHDVVGRLEARQIVKKIPANPYFSKLE